MGVSAIDGSNYTDINASTIDGWIEEGWEWGTPISHEKFMRAQVGDWFIVLTPTISVPRAWFPKSLAGCHVLGLASGGGQQMPIMAACGARCTVLDYSERQLASEREVAEREGYEIECVRADMTHPLPFADEAFDLKEDGVQFSHAFDEQIRGQLQAGFALIDCYEDTDGEGRLHDLRIPTFWATCAERR